MKPGGPGAWPRSKASPPPRGSRTGCCSTPRITCWRDNLSSFSVVEAMRQGMHPTDAGMAALRQIWDDTIDPLLLNARRESNFNVKLFIVNADGAFARVALYGGDDVKYAVCTENGAELRRYEALIDERGQFLD